ncbi:MAG: NADPH-dependent assimilatory sulfite reductase hemoprotein subunit, partial [Planctomycetota bacterium]
MSTDTPQKLNKVEKIKDASNFLRGELPTELHDEKDHFGSDSLQLLKFFGTYQQDDRDLRVTRRKEGLDKAFSCMVRCRIPGGRLTSEQLLTHLDLCEELANSTLKITTRQTFQFHGIPKSDLRTLVQRINAISLSTLAACGDVNRNVMCCPAKRVGPVYDEMHRLTDEITEGLAPKTRAYQELFLIDPDSGEKELVASSKPDIEPLYGARYLPRKFKVGIALPEDNCIDIYTQDLGFLAIVRDGVVIGYNVLVGGGMGNTPALKRTYPALGKRMAFCTPDQALEVAQAVLKVQRDYGNREDRKVARMKYLVDKWGVEKFRRAVEEYFGGPLKDCTPDDVTDVDHHMGWQAQGDGKWSYGLNIENGRLHDSGDTRLKETLRSICAKFQPEIRLTAKQSIIFCDFEESQKAELEQMIRDHQTTTSEDTSTVRSWSMACVGLPTCGLAVTESERMLPSIIDQLEQPLKDLGLENERFSIHMTGCPNGCARPYNSDIGLVGKSKDSYTLYLGGTALGTRLSYIFRDKVPAADVPKVLTSIFKAFKENRE